MLKKLLVSSQWQGFIKFLILSLFLQAAAIVEKSKPFSEGLLLHSTKENITAG